MRQVGYSREFAAGVICNAGTLGILIPPSIVMVVYAAATDVSVGRMFLAGIIPGHRRRRDADGGHLRRGPDQELAGPALGRLHGDRKSGIEAVLGLLLIIIILGGIYGGIFTPTEAAAVAAVYAFFVALFVYRDIGPLKGVPWRLPGEGIPALVLRNLWLTLAPAWGFVHRDTRRCWSSRRA